MTNQLLIGIGAGLTAALLYASAATLSPLAVVLFYLGPLPIFLATLGWGKITGLIAGGISAATIAAAQSLAGGALFLASVIVPAILLSHLARLSRESGEGQTEWYPPGRLVVWSSLISATITVATILLLGIGVEDIEVAVRRLVDELVSANPELSENRASIGSAAGAIARVLVPISSVSWALALIVNLWLAGRILRLSDRLNRTWPDLRTIVAPVRLHFALLAAILISFVGGQIGLVALVFAACLTLVYLLVGLSIIHYLLPEQPMRPIILGAIYFILLFFSLPLSFLPIMIVAGIGLAEPFLGLRPRAAISRGEPPPPTFD